MRALHVVRPATGGMKGQALALCSGLRERAWDVELACPSDSPIYTEARAVGFEVHAVDIAGPLDPVRDISAINVLRGVVRAGDYDVVHAHGFKAGLVGRLGATLGGCRCRLVTVHNHVLYRDDISSFTKWRYRVVERLLARWTERIIAVSESIREELLSEYRIPPRLVVTVHNGIDLPAPPEASARRALREDLGVGPEGLLVGTACRFAPQKAVDCLIRAAATIHDTRGDIRFVIGGDGPLRSELEALAVTLGLADSLVFPGTVTDMPTFLSSLDVYVSTSLSEGLPLGLIEAAALAVPIVATAVGGTPEIVRDGVSGILVPPGNVEAVADGILALVDDPARRGRMGEAGHAIARGEFGTARMIDETLAVYESALHAEGR